MFGTKTAHFTEKKPKKTDKQNHHFNTNEYNQTDLS